MRLLVLLLSLLWTTPALAQQLTLSVDRPIIGVGERVAVQLEIEGVRGANPTLQSPAGLQLTPAGVSSQMSIVQGEMTSSTMQNYNLVASQAGEFTLGPAVLRQGDQEWKSNAITITVSADRRAVRSAAADGRELYADARVSDTNPFVGESFTYELQVGAAVATRGMNWEDPDYGTLSAEPGVSTQQDERVEVQDGRRYQINTLARPLFAVEPGPVTITPSRLHTEVVVGNRGLFSRTRRADIASEPVELDVRPLPTEGRPDGFSGAVGRFRLSAELDNPHVQVGETATLTVTLQGRGALRSPKLAFPFPAELRVYDEQPEHDRALVQGHLRSRVIQRYALIPLEPGAITIEAPTFSYFDADAEEYRVARAAPVSLQVGGEAITAPVTARSAELDAQKQEVEVLGSDILPLHSGPRVFGDRRGGLRSLWVLGLLLLPTLAFGGVAGWTWTERNRGTDAGQRRQRARVATAALRDARQAAADGDWQAAERALRQWLTARLERAGEAMAPTEAANHWTAASGEGGEELRALLDRAEAARFGGAPAGELAEAIADWLGAHR